MTNDTPPQAEFVIERIAAAVRRYREAPFHSADFTVGEIVTILDTMPANDAAAPPQAIERTAVEAFADGNAVHVNMLRGSIAKPTAEQIIHIYGEEALSAALATRSPIRKREREQIARIVDPVIFETGFHSIGQKAEICREVARAKADDILALLANPVTGDAVVEQVAEALWQDDYRRSMGRDRLVPWSEANEDDANQKRSYARAAIRSLTNSTDKGDGE